MALSVAFCLAVLLLTLGVAATWGILWAAVFLIVGGPVLGGVAGLLLMTPIGYLFCGRRAMQLGRALTTRADQAI
jgi:hypothetical protein